MLLSSVSSLVFTAALVAGHGWVSNITVGNQTFGGYNPTVAPWAPDQGTITWPSWNTDTGPVLSNNVSHPDIVCQKNATNSKKIAIVAAGSDLLLQWTKWPDSHHGPIFSYLADCRGDCAAANKTELEWFKIAEMGQISLGPGGGTPGFWAADQLRENNGSWTVHIPASVKPGNYVLRNEILALHSAYDVGAAQFYPVCLNLRLTGSGTDSPQGVVGQKLYSDTDPGVHYNIYNDESKPVYKIPGPPLYTASVSS